MNVWMSFCRPYVCMNECLNVVLSAVCSH